MGAQPCARASCSGSVSQRIQMRTPRAASAHAATTAAGKTPGQRSMVVHTSIANSNFVILLSLRQASIGLIRSASRSVSVNSDHKFANSRQQTMANATPQNSTLNPVNSSYVERAFAIAGAHAPLGTVPSGEKPAHPRAATRGARQPACLGLRLAQDRRRCAGAPAAAVARWRARRSVAACLCLATPGNRASSHRGVLHAVDRWFILWRRYYLRTAPGTGILNLGYL